MRISNQTVYDAIKSNLSKTSQDLNKANQIVSSGKRISTFSDDPIGITQALGIKSTLSRFEQLGRNITMGKSWLKASESAMTHVQNLISDTKALSVQMASGTVGAQERQSASTTIQNTLEEVVSLGNTQVNGRYIFSGSKTDTTAFSQDGTYNGDNSAFTIKAGKDTSVEIGKDGSDAFGNIFTTLTDFKTALENNDIQEIQAALGSLDNDFDHISNKISDIGSKMIHMETRSNILEDSKISSTERLSKIEDADIAEAVIDLKEKELAYQAALSSSAKVMQTSLVDYV